MNSKSVYRKKRVGSCLALCLIGAVMSSTMSIPAWAHLHLEQRKMIIP